MQTRTVSNEIKLRKFGKLSSTKHLFNILSDDSVARPYGLAWGERAIELEAQVKHLVRNEIVYEAVLNGKVIGFASFRMASYADVDKLLSLGVFSDDEDLSIEIAEKTLEISYALDANFIGKGYGKQLAKKAIDQFFREYDCACIVGGYLIFDDTGENVRSKNVLEKLGFVPFETYKRCITYADEAVYANNLYLMNPIYQKRVEEWQNKQNS